MIMSNEQFLYTVLNNELKVNYIYECYLKARLALALRRPEDPARLASP